MAVGARRALALSGTLAASWAAFGVEAATIIAEAVAAGTLATLAALFAIRASTALWTTRTTRTRTRTCAGFTGVRLLWAGAGVAMAGWAGVYAFGHIPATERSGVAFRQRPRTFFLALLEWLLRLLGGGFAADGQAAMLAWATTATAAILPDVIEATQFAAFIGDVVAVDVTLAAAFVGYMHGRLGGLALADNRLQRQRGGRAIFQSQFLAQRFDLSGRQFL
jgi:hypothetical protein